MENHNADAYPASDELPHAIGPDPLWQESVVLTWWDAERGVGGFHRIGHEAHADGGVGRTTAWIGLCTRDGQRFVKHVNSPLRANDRDDGTFKATDAYQASFGDEIVWTIDDADAEMRLVAEDFTPRFDLFRAGGSVVADFAPGHIETGCRVRGTARLGDQTFDVDGLGYRDHSWGRRDWTTLLSHRWIAGSCGPDFTVNATTWHAVDGTLRGFGVICRKGEIFYAKSVDILVYMEPDAQTHRGGVVTLDMEDGERIVLRPTVIDGFVTLHNNIGVVDVICEIEHQGQRGFCDFEISTNPRAGSGPISGLIGATMTQGLSRKGDPTC